jgi:hypothetical protein
MREGAKIGAILGLVLFLIFGLAPGFMFGAYATITILSQFIVVDPTMAVTTLIVIGGLVGIAAAAFMFITVCGLLGGLVGGLIQ